MADEVKDEDTVAEPEFNPTEWNDKDVRPDWWPEEMGYWNEDLGHWQEAEPADEEASATWEAKVAEEGESDDGTAAWEAKVAEEGEYDESEDDTV